MAKFSRKLLERVATQMNEVMGLDPAIDTQMPDDDTLLDTIVWEARGRDVVKDAIRADDFVSDDKDKKTFADDVHQFFVDAGVWDDENKVAVMAAKKDGEKPAKDKKKSDAVDRKAEKKEEAASEDEAGDEQSEPEEGETEQVPTVTDKETTMSAKDKKAAAKKPEKKDTKTEKKAAAKKPGKPEKKVAGGFKNQGIGALTRELIAKHPDKGNAEIAEMVNKKLGTSTPPASVAWHRNQMKQKKAKKK